MKKSDAILALKEGKKITHRYFGEHEYVFQDGDQMVHEDGARISVKEFWLLRDGGLAWNEDWEIYTGKIVPNTVDSCKDKILTALSNLKTEFDESRKLVLKYAPEDEFKQGYKKAMTNVMAILSERIRIIKQDGDPQIK